MHLDPWTIAFEFVNFLVLVLLLRRFFFRPVAETIARRRTEIEKGHADLAKRETAAQELRETYEARMTALAAEERQIVEEARARGEREAGEIVQATRDENRARRKVLDEELAEVSAQVVERLRDELSRLAVTGAREVLREAGTDELSVTYARSAARSLRRELDRITPDTVVELEIASDRDQTPAANAVQRELGAPCSIRIRSNPELVAGVRLRSGDVEVEASARATLQRWLRDASQTEPRAARG